MTDCAKSIGKRAGTRASKPGAATVVPGSSLEADPHDLGAHPKSLCDAICTLAAHKLSAQPFVLLIDPARRHDLYDQSRAACEFAVFICEELVKLGGIK